MIINEEYQLVDVAKLRLHPQNPRVNDLGIIRESIDTNGFYGALVVNRRTGHILAGNHRYKAAIEQKIEALPVIYVDVDEQTALRILAADNRASDVGRYDEQALVSLLEEIEDFTGTGYNQAALDLLVQSITTDLQASLTDNEVDLGKFEDFDHQCPRCGFEYDAKS